MSSDGETRAGAQTADSSAAADAWSEREARMGADIAAMLAGHAPGHDEQLVHHDGVPSPATQMATHGQAAPSTPYEGGGDSASDRIG
jgi:poly(3-hydroxybutyrate) depolymerase